ncbi:oxygen-independent coproporphyrinogen-3 oxidase [Ectothiorhodospira mobilis]|uniref:Heme chaperone HemW n=1 Tax=Ectothiorhodospira mobilis TaxID=195064 RepID=A0A1I4PCH8_ECTMO|nr:radical SAM family heme chaperone HemW [Ectothiorhodospira mobilis]SFM25534.1 oxygen-independent coproporphyrinogen-3 oxidase [Ectothiorhodospira mobilis]
MPTPPLALYVHIPWCVRKCPYCDFNSHAAREIPEEAYLQALLADLEVDLQRLPQRALVSVFIGGGTPSLFTPQTIGRLLERAARRPGLVHDAEITLEANPGTLERARFRGFRDAGVNRLSIGAQSLDDTLLRRLGRIHDARAVVDAVAAARSAGFTHLNLDLMCALPGQTPAQARADLDAALALEPEHLSWYELTLEAGTAFARHPPALPDEDARAAMQEAGRERLQRAGFEHYEVSAHARPGHHCRHNLNYWRFGDYLGIGAGAHGKHTLPGGRILRRWKQADAATFMAAAMAGDAVDGTEALDPPAATFDFMLNALRLTQGVPATLFTRHTGLPLSHLEPARGTAVARGLLQDRPDRLQATALGRRYLDDLVALFIPQGN